MKSDCSRHGTTSAACSGSRLTSNRVSESCTQSSLPSHSTLLRFETSSAMGRSWERHCLDCLPCLDTLCCWFVCFPRSRCGARPPARRGAAQRPRNLHPHRRRRPAAAPAGRVPWQGRVRGKHCEGVPLVSVRWVYRTACLHPHLHRVCCMAPNRCSPTRMARPAADLLAAFDSCP